MLFYGNFDTNCCVESRAGCDGIRVSRMVKKDKIRVLIYSPALNAVIYFLLLKDPHNPGRQRKYEISEKKKKSKRF